MYRTECAMYDEVSVGNPGKVPYCTEQDKIEPDCQHCKRPYVTNADRIRSMTDEELAEWFAGHDAGLIANVLNNDYVEPTKENWLEWLKWEV